MAITFFELYSVGAQGSSNDLKDVTNQVPENQPNQVRLCYKAIASATSLWLSDNTYSAVLYSTVSGSLSKAKVPIPLSITKDSFVQSIDNSFSSIPGQFYWVKGNLKLILPSTAKTNCEILINGEASQPFDADTLFLTLQCVQISNPSPEELLLLKNLKIG